MGHDRFERMINARLSQEKPVWKEILESALAGLYPSDQQLERMLDQLERTP